MESNTNTLTTSSESRVKPSVIARDTSAMEKRKQNNPNAEKTDVSSPKRKKLSPIVYDKSSASSSTDLNKSMMDNKITTTDKSKTICSHGTDCEFGKNCAYVQALAICGSLAGRKLVKTGSSVNKINQKCKYWPQCKSGSSCMYTHPPVMCTKFPMCRFGNKCAYTHPRCKYGLSCANEECMYFHPIERQCKYYPTCRKSKCPYLHPVVTVDTSKFTWYKKN